MAIFTSEVFSQISGSIGGITYSHNRFGMYIRARTTPVNPQSSRQTEIRAIFAALALSWRQDVTDAQRDQWRVYGDNVVMKNKLGQDVYLTGYNHYIRSNSLRVLAGLSRVDDGPAILDKPGEDPEFAIIANQAGQVVSVTFDDTLPWVTDNSAGCYVFGGLPVNSARDYFGGPWRFMDFMQGDSASPVTSPQTMTAPFQIQAGQRFDAYARIGRSDARTSDDFQDNTVVAP